MSPSRKLGNNFALDSSTFRLLSEKQMKEFIKNTDKQNAEYQKILKKAFRN